MQPRRRYYLVYRTVNLVNGRFYVGAHETFEINDGYLGSGKLLKRAIKKYGIDKFKRTVIARCPSRRAMYRLEKQIISKVLGDPLCYNIAAGGKGGFQHVNAQLTPEARREIQLKGGAALKEKIANDPALREKMAKECKERLQSPAVRAKRVHARRTSPRYHGLRHSEEAKAKVGAANSLLQAGAGNSQYGTAWLVNDEQEVVVRVPQDLVAGLLELGWRRGRVMRYRMISALELPE